MDVAPLSFLLNKNMLSESIVWGSKVSVMRDHKLGIEEISAPEWSKEYFEDLMRQFGKSCGPMTSSLHIPMQGSLVNLPVRSAFESDEQWVSSYCKSLQDMIGMSRYPVKVFALERDQPKLDGHRELSLCRNPDAKERYYTDAYGHPVAYYEPSRLEKPCYLLRRLTDVLSDMLQFGLGTGSESPESCYESRSDLIACFLGLGLVRIELTNDSKDRDLALMRGTLLFLREKNYSRKEIEDIYADILRAEYETLFEIAMSDINENDLGKAA